jgi:hypothetical protein
MMKKVIVLIFLIFSLIPVEAINAAMIYPTYQISDCPLVLPSNGICKLDIKPSIDNIPHYKQQTWTINLSFEVTKPGLTYLEFQFELPRNDGELIYETNLFEVEPIYSDGTHDPIKRVYKFDVIRVHAPENSYFAIGEVISLEFTITTPLGLPEGEHQLFNFHILGVGLLEYKIVFNVYPGFVIPEFPLGSFTSIIIMCLASVVTKSLMRDR